MQRIAGGPIGLFGIGSNGLVYGFPEFGGVWREWHNRLKPRVLASSRRGLLYADDTGHVGEGNRGRLDTHSWTLEGPVSALATNADGSSMYAVSKGRIMSLQTDTAVPGPCAELRVTALAVSSSKLWVSDGQRVFVANGSSCDAAPGAPPRIQRLAAYGDRVLALDDAGDVFRLRDGAWKKLPRPLKFHPDRIPEIHVATDVAVSASAEWLRDDEGNVFVLSESD